MDFLTHLKTYLSDIEIKKLDVSLKGQSEHALLLNTEKMNEDTLLSIYPSLKRHPIVKNAFLYDKNELDLGKSVYYELGCFYLQEPSAMLPAFLLNPSAQDLLLDLCAAPGGKSIQASLLMDNKGLIIANDIARNRAVAILENAERMGRGNLMITYNDFSSIYHHFNDTFDKIILDAPCSGSGMFRKDNKMLEDWSYQKVLKNAEIQKSLICMSYLMLKPGGTMVYSTCSFSYEEDEEVVQYLLDHTDALLIDIPSSPLYYQSREKGYGIHLFPFLFPGEGHYICLIKKPGVLKQKTKSKDYSKAETFGDYRFLISQPFSFKYLNVIRSGVKMGQIDHKDIRFDYHYARFIKTFPSLLEIDLQTLKEYYQGESINTPFKKGYVLLKYEGINVDIAKSDGRIIKNRLPKGLRKRFSD